MSDNSNRSPRILVTGGAGYIGAHTVFCLLEAGYSVTVVDNLVNAQPESLERVRQLVRDITPAAQPFDDERLQFHEVDLLDLAALERVFQAQPAPFWSCIHFAALKAVGESVVKPLLYYENNLGECRVVSSVE